MTQPIPLDSSWWADLTVLRRLGDEKMQAVVQCLAALPPSPLPPHELAAKIAGALSGDQQGAGCIMRRALELQNWARQGVGSPAELVGRIRASIDRRPEWKAEIDGWEMVQPIFEELVALPVMRLTAAIIDLAFEHSNVLRRARILTDIRPVFDPPGNTIEGSVITYTLRLFFHASSAAHDLSIAMDESDVRRLADQCDRALRKSVAAQKLMIEKAGVPAIISGAGDDARP